MVEGIYSFNTICGTASVRETNSQKKVSSIEFIKSSHQREDPLKADVWSRAHKGISALVSGKGKHSKQRYSLQTSHRAALKWGRSTVMKNAC